MLKIRSFAITLCVSTSLASAGALCATAASADTRDIAPTPSPDATEWPGQTVVSAARIEQPIREVGQAISVLDRETIERRQTPLVTDLLATVPGVSLSQNGGPGGVTSVRIRGAEGDQTLVIVDGIRMNDPSSPGGGFDFGTLLTGDADRIEVLRGPDSLAWGSQAIGGVVNIITAAPNATLGGRARATLGNRKSAEVNGAVGDRIGPVGLRLGGHYLHNRGASAYDRGRERDGLAQYGGTLRADARLADGLTLDLVGLASRSHVREDGYANSFPYGLVDTRDYSIQRRLGGLAAVNLALFGQGDQARWRQRLAFSGLSSRRRSHDRDATPSFQYAYRGRTERLEYHGRVKAAHWLGLLYGAERQWDRSNSTYDDRAKTHATAIFGQALLRPMAGLALSGGARHDHHKRFGGKTSFGANFAWTPDLGTRFGQTTLRATYAEGFKAPTLYQLFSTYGNKALNPETARSFDVGIEQRTANAQLGATLTYFHRRTRNQIDFVSCFGNAGAICADRGNFGGYYANTDRTRAQGVEFTIDGRPVPELIVAVAYTYTKSTDRTPGSATYGKDLARRPRNTLSTSVDWVRGRLGLGFTVRMVDKSWDNAANTTPIRESVVTAIRGRVRLFGDVDLIGRIDNLFSVHHPSAAGYGSEGRRFNAGVEAHF